MFYGLNYTEKGTTVPFAISTRLNKNDMTDLEFQLQNEISDLRATINGLRAELKQREEAYNELQGMFEDCQRKLSEALKREEIATKIINEKRKEIERLKNE